MTRRQNETRCHCPSAAALADSGLASVGLLWLMHWLPFSLQAAVGNASGWLLAQLPGKRRHIVATNLALCFPDTPESVRRLWLRQTFQASARAALEHGVLWWGSEARLRRLIQIDNPEAAMVSYLDHGCHPGTRVPA